MQGNSKQLQQMRSESKQLPENIDVNLPIQERKMESLADILAAQDELKRKL